MGLRCPKCGSSRVRRGYERLALPLRMIGIQSLLCDGCNLSHRGFALPGTVPIHSTKRKHYYRREHPSQMEEVESQYAGAQEESMRVSDVLPFGWYYVKLRFKVLFGLYQTTHSVALKYRWRHWQHLHRSKLR